MLVLSIFASGPNGDIASLVGRDSVSRDQACVRTAGRRHFPAFFFEILAPATSGNATVPEHGCCPLLVMLTSRIGKIGSSLPHQRQDHGFAHLEVVGVLMAI